MGGGKSFGRQSSNVTQRQSTPPHAAAPAQQNATNSAAKPARRARRRRAEAPVGRDARRPRRGPGPRMARTFARPGRRLRQHPADRPAGARRLVAMWRIFKARSAASNGATPRRLRLPGRGRQPRQRQRTGAVQPGQRGQRCVGTAMGAFGHAFDATPADGDRHGSSLSGRRRSGRQHDRFGAGRFAVLGHPHGFDVDGFLGAAKRNFVTLQDAWDRADVVDAAFDDDRRDGRRKSARSWPTARATPVVRRTRPKS
jgi:hypothetical protein